LFCKQLFPFSVCQSKEGYSEKLPVHIKYSLNISQETRPGLTYFCHWQIGYLKKKKKDYNSGDPRDEVPGIVGSLAGMCT